MTLDKQREVWYYNKALDSCITCGGVAHLGERLNGIQEVRGSIPLISTTNQIASAIWFFCFSGRFCFRLFAPFILRYDSYAQNGMNLSFVLPVRSFTSPAGPPLSPYSAARPKSPNHINQRKKRPALCQRREPGVLNDRFAHKSAGKPCQELAGAWMLSSLILGYRL